MFIIRKNTYNIKDDLKAVGCRWNSKYKVWIFPNKEATKGFKFEVVESLDKLGTSQNKIYKKPFTPSCCNLNGVIVREDYINDKLNLFTVKGMGEEKGNTFLFYGRFEKYSVGEILENIPCKIEYRNGSIISIKYRLDI